MSGEFSDVVIELIQAKTDLILECKALRAKLARASLHLNLIRQAIDIEWIHDMAREALAEI